MKKFILRLLLLFSPLLFLFGAFLFFDPFAMYGPPSSFTIAESMNDDAQTFRTFDTYNDSLQYNAFILGNSKTLAILSTDWKKQIGDDTRVFKFGSPGESILNMRKKLEYAILKGNNIDHVLLLLDNKILKNTDNTNKEFTGPVYLKGHKSSYHNKLDYLGTGFYYYLYDGYFRKQLNYLKRSNHTASMQTSPNWDLIENVMHREEFELLNRSNEFFRWDTEQQILNDSAAWVQSLPKMNGDTKNYNQVLDQRDIAHLKAIKDMFDKYQTKYKIVFGPEYDCIKLDGKVKEEFIAIFGYLNVFDFSADTAYCNNPYNFYEPNHYRPIVGKKMLERIYE